MNQAPVFTIVDPDQMSILGLMIGEIVASNLALPEKAVTACRLKGSVGVTAGRMSVTLRFDRGDIRLTRGLGQKLRSAVSGTLEGLLQVSLGRIPIRRFLKGELSLSGNLCFLVRILPLIRAPSNGSRA